MFKYLKRFCKNNLYNDMWNNLSNNIKDYNRNINKFNYIDEDKLKNIINPLILYDKKKLLSMIDINLIEKFINPTYKNIDKIRNFNNIISLFWCINKFEIKDDKIQFYDIFENKLENINLNEILSLLNGIIIYKKEEEYKTIVFELLNNSLKFFNNSVFSPYQLIQIIYIIQQIKPNIIFNDQENINNLEENFFNILKLNLDKQYIFFIPQIFELLNKFENFKTHKKEFFSIINQIIIKHYDWINKKEIIFSIVNNLYLNVEFDDKVYEIIFEKIQEYIREFNDKEIYLIINLMDLICKEKNNFYKFIENFLIKFNEEIFKSKDKMKYNMSILSSFSLYFKFRLSIDEKLYKEYLNYFLYYIHKYKFEEIYQILYNVDFYKFNYKNEEIIKYKKLFFHGSLRKLIDNISNIKTKDLFLFLNFFTRINKEYEIKLYENFNNKFYEEMENRYKDKLIDNYSDISAFFWSVTKVIKIDSKIFILMKNSLTSLLDNETKSLESFDLLFIIWGCSNLKSNYFNEICLNLVVNFYKDLIIEFDKVQLLMFFNSFSNILYKIFLIPKNNFLKNDIEIIYLDIIDMIKENLNDYEEEDRNLIYLLIENSFISENLKEDFLKNIVINK